MFDRLGALGVVGLVLVVAGLVLVGLENPVIAGGLVLVLVGLGLAVKSFISGMMSAFGMGF
jgi:hypothetical protein